MGKPSPRKSTKRKAGVEKVNRTEIKKVKIACGMCGNTRELLKTECCDNWICDDECKYPMYPSFFSYTCYRKHWKYSLCAFHHAEGHEGKWQECLKCKEEFSEDDYKEFTSEDNNFKKLGDASKITCVVCGFKSKSKKDFAFELNDGYYCTKDECQKRGKPSPGKIIKSKTGVKKVSRAEVKKVKIACGMCGNTRELLKTECCDNWICDDEGKNPMYPSFSSYTCYRKHWKYSLCAFHHAEGHEVKWQECLKCKEEFSKDDYKEFTSEDYNFEKLGDTSKITCVSCGFKSKSKKDFVFQLNNYYYCTKEECQKRGKPPLLKSTKRKAGVKKVSRAEVENVRRSLRLMGKNQKASKK